MKRHLRWALLLSLSVLVAGCGGTDDGGAGGGGGTPTGGGSTASKKSDLKVGLVTDVGGVGDQSFNMMANQGLEKAKSELGVEAMLVESQQASDYSSNLQRMAEKGCKLVFAVGFSLAPAVKEIAARYPDTQFAIIDSAEPAASNVANLVFKEEEGSFLVGMLAGGMSKSGKIGFVGGMEIPLIKKFEAGYRAGARTANPSVTVSAKYTNNWTDVSKGKELALSLFNEGADVVMHASGQCGLGVIEAAKQKGPGFWAIGVDADQDHLGTADSKNPAAPSRVLTSMLKRVDTAVFDTVKHVSDGSFKGGQQIFGVKDGGVGLSPLRYTKADIPEKLLAEVARMEKAIAAGEVKPPSTLEEESAFKAPTVSLK